MNAVYRITVTHDPAQPHYLQYTGTVHRLSDDLYMSGSTRCAETATEAVEACREWIASLSVKQDDLTIDVDEDGNTAPADLSLVHEYAPDTEPYPTTA